MVILKYTLNNKITMALNFELDITYIEGDATSCQGVDSHDSHPKVFLDLTSGGVVICPYCGAKFKKK